jgi:preprotein translocase subunit SecY
MSYLSAVRKVFRMPDLRDKILITILLLIFYKMATVLPVPGVTPEMIEEVRTSEVAGTTAFQALNVLAGGALANLSIVALSIYPYFAAIELVNKFTPIIPRLQEISREPGGADKLTRLAVLLTIPLAVITALIGEDIALPLLDVERSGFMNGLVVVTALTAGTFFTLWIARQIDEDGIGNGVSLIIFANIAGAFPTFFSNIEVWGLVKTALIVAVLIAMTYIMIQMWEGQRRVPVQYGKRVRGRKQYGGASTHIPIPVAPTGLNTLESGYGFMILVGVALLYLSENHASPLVSDASRLYVNFTPLVLFFLVLVMTFFSMSVMVTERNYADNLQRSGGFIPGIRPGKLTNQYMLRVTMRLAWLTAPFLALLSVSPWLLQWIFGLAEPVYLVIVIWISIRIFIDLLRMFEAQMVLRTYDRFIQ